MPLAFTQEDFLVHNMFTGWKAVLETNLTGTFLCCKEGKMEIS